METIFSFSNLFVLPFWALMILLPHWRWTKRLIASPLIAVPPALIYAALVVPQIGSLFGTLANPELARIAALLGTPEGATIGWAHFLTFDLFVGRWAYLDSHEKNITAWLVSPTLFMVLMVGPVGFLLYLILRYAHAAWAKLAPKPAATAA